MRFLSFTLFFLCTIPRLAQVPATDSPTPQEKREALEKELAEMRADVLPQFPGGPEKMKIWLMTNLTVPYVELREDTVVTVYVEFTVESTGHVTNPRIKYPGFRQLDKEVILLFSRMPRWAPGRLNGKAVPLSLTLPINVALANSMRKPVDVPTPELSNLPQYNGGGKALAYFIRKNLKYPEEARKAGVSGKVLVEFLVLANGAIDNVSTIGSALGYGLEEEATRVVQKMPRSKPAKLDGKPVSARHQLVITFDPPPSH